MAAYLKLTVAAFTLLAFTKAQTPLPLPADPAIACGPDVTRAWTRDYPSCARALLGNAIIYNPTQDIDDECCEGTVRYFGSNSVMGHANCFCDPDVYARFVNAEYPIDIGMYLGQCTLRGYEIPIYEMDTGACSGAPYNLTGLYPTVVYPTFALANQSSLHQYLHDLNKDGIILTSFIFGLIAAVGFVGACFVLCYNLVMSAIPSKKYR